MLFSSSLLPADLATHRKGTLVSRRDRERLVHLDEEEVVIDARYYELGEVVRVGDSIKLPVHMVRVVDLCPDKEGGQSSPARCVEQQVSQSIALPMVTSAPQSAASDPSRVADPYTRRSRVHPRSPMSTRWDVVFSPVDSSSSVLEGGLILRHEARRLVLLDPMGIAIDVRQLSAGEQVRVGDTLSFPCFTSTVGVRWASPHSRVGGSNPPTNSRNSLDPRALFHPTGKNMSPDHGQKG